MTMLKETRFLANETLTFEGGKLTFPFAINSMFLRPKRSNIRRKKKHQQNHIRTKVCVFCFTRTEFFFSPIACSSFEWLFPQFHGYFHALPADFSEGSSRFQ